MLRERTWWGSPDGDSVRLRARSVMVGLLELAERVGSGSTVVGSAPRGQRPRPCAHRPVACVPAHRPSVSERNARANGMQVAAKTRV
jgi:hypothetical protein